MRAYRNDRYLYIYYLYINMKPTDVIIISSGQRRKAVLGKAFNMQHELLDLIFKDSYDHGFNNFINLYERSVNWSTEERVLFEVKSEFREKIYLQWNHGPRIADTGYNDGLKFPGYISYMRVPTKEDEPHKLIDVDAKNLDNIIEPKIMMEYESLVNTMEAANINAKLMGQKDMERLHEIVNDIASVIRDEFGRYTWVGGVFWGGRGFSYWGDWNIELMKGLADAGMVDEMTNVGEMGYHAQRVCSVQFYKPTLVTNYHCDLDYTKFKYCCPAFFILKNENLGPLTDKYYKMSFITTYKASLPFDKVMKWQDQGIQDIKLWDAWRDELMKIEDEIRTLMLEDER